MEENQNEVHTTQNGNRGFGKGKWFALGVLTGLLVALGITGIVFGGNRISLLNSSSTTMNNTDSEENVLTSSVISKIQLLENSIHTYYIADVSENSLEDGLYKGMVESLEDPYSTYYTAEEIKSVRESAEGVYYGIGAYIGMDQDTSYCKITKVMEGTPAESAGLKDGDLIVKINGEDARGLTTSDAVSKIKGEENTNVVLTVYRSGETDYLDITVTRKKIESPTVLYNKLDNGMAYIQIREFDQVTTEQFQTKMQEAKADGMKGMILDLRDNPGGSLATVVDIAEQILPEGLIVYTEDKNGKREEYRSDGKNELKIPLVVLVNENSASAAEILSGAIKDYKMGKLLGVKTFGKGIVQKIFSITDGSAIKLTISHYYTPNGNDIHGVGIEPDETLEFDYDQYQKDGTDNQLERAKEILAGEMK